MADDTFEQARVVPDIYLESQYFVNDFVGAGDNQDYYKFYNLFGPSNLYAVLNNLTSDADIYIYNQDRVEIARSTRGGNLSENIPSLALQPFQYYFVKIVKFGEGSTNYNLLLINDYAGSNLNTARDNGISWGQSSDRYWPNKIFFNDYLDFRDNVDLVKFQMEAPGTISIRRLPVQNNLVSNLELLDAGGNVLANGSDTGGGLNIDRYSTSSGTYYVRFSQLSGASDYQFRITTDYAGDRTGFTARELGDLTGSSRRMFDMVGGGINLPTYGDDQDLYKFTISRTAPVDISLVIPSFFEQPTFDANLNLARDTNNDSFISSGEVFLSSANMGNDRLATVLNPGTYYVQVVQNGAYTSYELDLDSDFDANPGDPVAYNNMSKANQINLNGEIFVEDGFGISAGDIRDFFKFQMFAPGKFSASVLLNSFFSRSTNIPTLQVIRDNNNNQRLDTGETITPVTQSSLIANLAAGTYYLATTGNGEQLAYQLRMSPDYSGNTFATSRVMASINGNSNQNFQDYIEQGFDNSSDNLDFYKFNLNGNYQISLNTTGVAGEDLSLSLLKDNNNNGRVDAGEILASSNVVNSPNERINTSLGAGSYFVEIKGINGGTNYNLNAGFNQNLTNPGIFSFSSPSYRINENGTPISVITINRSNGSTGAVSVKFTPTNGTAVAPGDFNNSSVTVNFANGQTSKTVTIGIVNDTLPENAETINLTLSNPTGGATIGTQNRATLTIVDNDLISGTPANDNLRGTLNPETIEGLGGNDQILAEGGNDILIGGPGNDKLTGGAGLDNFRFLSSSERTDTINDFIVVDDTIQVKASGFGGGLVAGASITAAQFALGAAATDNSDRFIYNRTNGFLLFDADGNGSTQPLHIATLSNKPNTFSHSDIFVI